MKFVTVGPIYPWRGGIAHHSAMLVRELAKRHEVEAVTFSRQYPSILFPGKSQYDPDGAPLPVPTHQWIDSMNPFSWSSTGRRIRAMAPDVLIFAHSLSFFGPAYARIAAIARRSGKTKILFICHNVLPHERRPGDRLLTKMAFRHADCFIVQSRSVEHDLLALIPRAVYRLIPHPVYEQFGAPLPKDEARRVLGLAQKRIVLFFGYIRPYKGLAVLIEALQALPDVALLVVGEFYEDEQMYRRMIGTHGLADRVVIVSDYVPNEHVARYFSAADAVILPYRSATQSGIAQIAYNFNKPVIVTDVGGLAEVVREGKTGFTVPPDDPKALAAAIRKFYDGAHETEFVRNVEAEKVNYSWAGFVRQLEELVR